jgi:glycosyl hydrolase family 16
MFWDGTRWVPERPATPTSVVRRRSRLVDLVATLPVLVLVPLLFSPFLNASAADPVLTVTGVAVPGGKVAASGSGWPAQTSLQLMWDGAAAGMPRARTSRSGTFTTSFVIPSNAAAPAAHVLGVVSASKIGRGVLVQGRAAADVTLLATVTVQVVEATAPDPTPQPPDPTAKPTPPPADPTPPPPPDPTASPPPDPTAPPPPDPTPRPTPDPTPPPDPGPVLTFSAECNGSAIDPDLRALYGAGDPGFGYDSDFMGNMSQVSIANGRCTITAERRSTPSGRPYATACIATYGTFGQKFGIFEARIRYGNGQGAWPAFWMLPVGQKNPYPEIDIFEAYPGDVNIAGPNLVVQGLHYAGEPVDPSLRTSMWRAVDAGYDLTGGFHTYKIVWTTNKVDFYFDGARTHTVTSHVPQVAMYPIVNLAMGNAGYRVDSTTPDVVKLDIDWIRVYKL